MTLTINDKPDSKKPTLLFITDEFSFYSGGNKLTHQLISAKNDVYYTYAVSKDLQSVFVFDKLKSIVSKKLLENLHFDIRSNLQELMKAASVSPADAVNVWGVVPRPYEVVSLQNGTWQIRHKIFNAMLPVVYHEESALHDALATLLVGGAVEPDPDAQKTPEVQQAMVYKQQIMHVLNSFNVADLPLRPDFAKPGSASEHGTLSDVHYNELFSVLPEADFEAFRNLESSWISSLKNAYSDVTTHFDKACGVVQNMELPPLDNFSEAGPYNSNNLHLLRSWYPGLQNMPDQALLCLHNVFCEDRESGSSSAFPFFVAGLHVKDKCHAFDCVDAGKLIVFKMLDGHSFEDAVDAVYLADKYHHALMDVVSHISKALSFIHSDLRTEELYGDAVVTIASIMSPLAKTQAS